jgi:alkylhydroperoxidase/carboxymuconolactone decarboxylase family protein YurZ
MENYLGVAKKAGITDQEIGAVQAIVMAMSGGRVMAQFGEVLTRSKVAK